MIKGKQKTEKEYRALEEDSSSSLKLFVEDRRKYYKRFVLQEKVKEEDSKAAIVGRVVECLLLEKDKFDQKFHESTVTSLPTGNMLLFVEALYKFTRDPNYTFEQAVNEAYKESGYKWTLDRVLTNFKGSDAEIYFNEICTARDKGLTVITLQDIDNAEKIVEELKTNEVTSHIFDIINNPGNRYEAFVQFQVEDFEIDELPLKAMMDILIIDHVKKTIQVYDLKCVWSVENFYHEYYLYRKAYIQAYVYKEAAYKTKENLDLEKYTVENPKFIVCDSINYYKPLIYTLNIDDIDDAYNGFVLKDRKYPGVKETIADLKWAKENNEWRISRNNSLNGGIVNIKS
jgi:hypothetical protein